MHEKKRNDDDVDDVDDVDDEDDDGDWSRWKSSTRYAIRTRFECTLVSGSAFGTESRERASLEFRGIQSYPYPLPSNRPLSLGNPRAPALVVFP